MASPRTPLPCPACEGLRTRLMEVRPDPDPPTGSPTVLRLRACLDCGELLASAERLVATDVTLRRLAELGRDRMVDGRAVRKAMVYPYEKALTPAPRPA